MLINPRRYAHFSEVCPGSCTRIGVSRKLQWKANHVAWQVVVHACAEQEKTTDSKKELNTENYVL